MLTAKNRNARRAPSGHGAVVSARSVMKFAAPSVLGGIAIVAMFEWARPVLTPAVDLLSGVDGWDASLSAEAVQARQVASWLVHLIMVLAVTAACSLWTYTRSVSVLEKGCYYRWYADSWIAHFALHFCVVGFFSLFFLLTPLAKTT